jgi:hypothetical protein
MMTTHLKLNNVKFKLLLKWRVIAPTTRAECTVHWFMYGVRQTGVPQNVNCRCELNFESEWMKL